jgi:pyruvate dehydrogenase E2 component (dihydrolipoamide acetyltransferase)
MEFESFDEGTLLHWNSEGETAPVDSLLAIIGDEEDVTALIAKSEPKIESESAKPEKKKLQLHQRQRRKKQLQPAALPEGVVLSPCLD